MVRTLIEGAPYDGAPAARDLGLVYTPIETTMRRTISWYLAQGLITRPLPGFVELRERPAGVRLTNRQRTGGIGSLAATGAAA